MNPRLYKAEDRRMIKGRFIHEHVWLATHQVTTKFISLFLVVNSVERHKRGFLQDLVQQVGMALLGYRFQVTVPRTKT